MTLMDRPANLDGEQVSHMRALLFGSAVILTVLIFSIDAFTSLGSAVAVLYVLVIVISAESTGSLGIKSTASACVLLTVIAFGYVHGLEADAQAVLRLVFSIAANGVTTTLLILRQSELENRRAAEATIASNENRYRNIFDTLAVAIWEHDFRPVKRELELLRESGVQNVRQYLQDHPEFVIQARKKVRITDVNQTALRLIGASSKEDFHTHLCWFLPENDTSFSECLVAIDEGQPNFQAETKVRNTQGRLIPVIVSISFPPDGEGLERVQGSMIDITERLQFQEEIEISRRELEHASRAAMIGEISASIAHEVNQPLSTTLNYIQAAKRWLERDIPNLHEAKHALREALVATEHSAAVVKRVRMLLGKAKSDNSELSLEATVVEAFRLKRSELASSGTVVSFHHCTRKPIILGDRILLQQVFINVISNALQAMDMTETQFRRLTVETETEGSLVKIKLSDSGSGLGENVGETLFKAFNTTKATGMGLGLAMCRSIVIAHGGSISIRDNGEMPGAVVEISLPCVPKEGRVILNDNALESASRSLISQTLGAAE